MKKETKLNNHKLQDMIKIKDFKVRFANLLRRWAHRISPEIIVRPPKRFHESFGGYRIVKRLSVRRFISEQERRTFEEFNPFLKNSDERLILEQRQIVIHDIMKLLVQEGAITIAETEDPTNNSIMLNGFIYVGLKDDYQ